MKRTGLVGHGVCASAGRNPPASARPPAPLMNLRRPIIRMNVSVTASQKRVPTSFMETLVIPCPPVDKQRRLISLLEAADKLRPIHRYALQMCDELIPAAFLEMFGDPDTNPKKWDQEIIDDVLESSQYGTSQKSTLDSKGYPILGMANITEDGRITLSPLAFVDLPIDAFESLKLHSGDIIFNRTNSAELVGKTACWRLNMDAVIASYLVRLRLKPHIVPEFFSALLNTKYFKVLFQERCKKAMGQSNISPTLLREFRIYVPPFGVTETIRKFSSNARKPARYPHGSSTPGRSSLSDAFA